MKALIFGAGGHARVIASLLDCPHDFVNQEQEDGIIAESRFSGATSAYIGVGLSNTARKKLYLKLQAHGISLPPLIAPTAFVARGATIGKACILMPGSIVMTGAVLRENCIVGTHSSIDHDCRIGAHTFIAPGVTFPGEVTVGDRCFFGVKSATFPRVTIGDDVVVRGGSLVIKDVASRMKVGGNPATVIGRLDLAA